MKKKLAVIILVLILIAIFVLYGVIVTKEVLNNYREDRRNTIDVMSKIDDEYASFESKISTYNNNLKKVVTLINESNYYAEFNKNNKEMIELLDATTNQIKEMSSYTTLKNSCDKTYSNGKTNRACSSYAKTYEKSINIYVDVIKAYNNIVAKINESFPDSKFDEYKSEFTDYVDYNKDGKYLGKEEIKKEKEVVQNEEEK